MKYEKLTLSLPRILFIVLVLFFLLLFGRNFKDTIVALLNSDPENLFLASVIVLVLFSIKSVMIFLPIAALHISTGFIFGPVWAIIINFLGTILCFSIPFFLGRHAQNYVNRLLSKHGRTKQLRKICTENQWFTSYILRISLAPVDLTSLFLGTLKISYSKYIVGSLVGITPRLIAATIMGASITNPGSPFFLGSLLAQVLIILASYSFYRRKAGGTTAA